MDIHEWSQVTDIVVGCTESLFGNFGVALKHQGPVEGTTPEDMTLAVIGFAGRQMCGSLLLNASNQILRKTHPACGDDPALSYEDSRDWSGELANQLLGRIKRDLLARGVVIQLSTPVTLTGIQVRVSASVFNSFCRPHRFEADGASLQVRFEAVVEPSVSLAKVPVTNDVLGPDGDFAFFD